MIRERNLGSGGLLYGLWLGGLILFVFFGEFAVTLESSRGQSQPRSARAGASPGVSASSFVPRPKTTTWAKSNGGNTFDKGYSIQQTTDGGYIVVGWTHSSNIDSSDLWVLKLDARGNVQWQRTHGGRSRERGYSIHQTADGGYIMAGQTDSYQPYGADVWVLKLDAKGNVEWQKTYYGEGEQWGGLHPAERRRGLHRGRNYLGGRNR